MDINFLGKHNLTDRDEGTRTHKDRHYKKAPPSRPRTNKNEFTSKENKNEPHPKLNLRQEERKHGTSAIRNNKTRQPNVQQGLSKSVHERKLGSYKNDNDFKHKQGIYSNYKDKRSQTLPMSIELRRKVNVEERYCTEIEILRLIKNSKVLHDKQNQSKHFICQEMEVSNLTKHEHNRTFEICHCDVSNATCMNNSESMSDEMIEKGIVKREMFLERHKQLRNHSRVSNMNQFLFYIVFIIDFLPLLPLQN